MNNQGTLYIFAVLFFVMLLTIMSVETSFGPKTGSGTSLPPPNSNFEYIPIGYDTIPVENGEWINIDTCITEK